MLIIKNDHHMFISRRGRWRERERETCLSDHIVMSVLGIEVRRITGYETDDISMFMYCLCIDDYYIAYRWLYFPTCWGFIIIQNVGTPMNHRPFWEQWVGNLVP